MIEHCLYGIKVFAEFAIFDGQCPVTAVAPGEHESLELRRLPSCAAAVDYPETFTQFSSHGREVELRTDRELAASVKDQPWRLDVLGVVSFTWTGKQQPMVYYQMQEQGTEELLVFWFVHIFLPLYLSLERGYDFIHSAAVEVDGQPILFIAPSTGGKSTLGDYFLKQGHPLLSDDKVATFLHEEKFYVVPSHPHHRPFRQFEVLGYPVVNFATSAKPVHAFYLLENRDPDSAVQITEITGFRKFEQLLPNYLYSFQFLQQQRLHWLAQLASEALVFKVERPWNLDRMPEVYEAICAHSRGLISPWPRALS